MRNSRRLATSAGLAAILAAMGCSASVDETPDGVDPTPENGADLPVAVSTYFAPSGYMGDTMGIVADAASPECKPRPEGAEGDCYRFTYTPGPQKWAGVYWQHPANNWGAAEGQRIEPGATTVKFYAAGSVGGEILKVTVGGIKDVTLPYADTVKAMGEFTLTTEMTQYTIDISGQTYESVIGGFSWSTNIPQDADPTTAAPIVFFLDDLIWE
jgi:hypothetical protein